MRAAAFAAAAAQAPVVKPSRFPFGSRGGGAVRRGSHRGGQSGLSLRIVEEALDSYFAHGRGGRGSALLEREDDLAVAGREEDGGSVLGDAGVDPGPGRADPIGSAEARDRRGEEAGARGEDRLSRPIGVEERFVRRVQPEDGQRLSVTTRGDPERGGDPSVRRDEEDLLVDALFGDELPPRPTERVFRTDRSGMKGARARSSAMRLTISWARLGSSATGVSEYARFTALPSARTSPVSRMTYFPRMFVHGAPSVRTTSSARVAAPMRSSDTMRRVERGLATISSRGRFRGRSRAFLRARDSPARARRRARGARARPSS